MKVLVLGAGAVGGYFGGRLVEKGEDVTFLVREKRQEQLKKNGLVINSVHGDFKTSNIKTITQEQQNDTYDLIILSVKAYHLENAIGSIKPFMHETTTLLPLLNGIDHIGILQNEFGEERIVGGLCHIESTLNNEGHIIQTSQIHHVTFGELNGSTSERTAKVQQLFEGANCKIRESENILKDLWNKYIFITAFSGITTLMDSAIGPILQQPEGASFYEDLIRELVTIAKAENAPLDSVDEEVNKHIKNTHSLGSTMKASMLRDIEKGYSIEVDHLQGEFLKKADKHSVQVPSLKVVYGRLKIYEINQGNK